MSNNQANSWTPGFYVGASCTKTPETQRRLDEIDEYLGLEHISLLEFTIKERTRLLLWPKYPDIRKVLDEIEKIKRMIKTDSSLNHDEYIWNIIKKYFLPYYVNLIKYYLGMPDHDEKALEVLEDYKKLAEETWTFNEEEYKNLVKNTFLPYYVNLIKYYLGMPDHDEKALEVLEDYKKLAEETWTFNEEEYKKLRNLIEEKRK